MAENAVRRLEPGGDFPLIKFALYFADSEERKKADSFNKLYEVIKTLIAPDGCPWDSVQTPESMKRYLVEETFEALEAINEKDAEHAKEELGDVIMNAVEIAALYEKQGKFSVDQVLDGAAEKLIRRHPHVFVKKEMTLDQLNVQWDKIKKSEGKKEKLSHEEKFKKMQKLLDSLAPEYGLQ